MSSFSLISDIPPRYRGPSVITFHPRPRNIISKMLKRRTLREEIQAFYARQVEGSPNIPAYLSNTVYAQLIKQQRLLFLKRLYTTPKKADDDAARIKKTYSSHNGLISQREPVEADLDVNIFDGHSLITSSRSRSSNESFSIPTAGNSSGSSSGSDSNINKAIPSRSEYAALESLLLQGSFNYALATQDLRLPTAWDPKSKGDNIELSGDKLQLTFKGTGKDDIEASSVRANHSMKKQCGIYYFEVQIISKGIDGHIAIGFCRKINSLDRLPGWEEHSWGYYGQNGHKSSGPGTDKSYGPRFTTGDVIGCGVDFRDMSAFYTKNGVHLGVAFKKIKETDLYPFIGFKSPGEKIMANFGSKPFKFDIKQHMLNEKRELIDGIALKPLEPHHSQSAVINHSIAKNLADKLVLDYLRHHGYTKSATALEKKMAALHGSTEWMEEDESVDLDAAHRQG
ncbi:SPRY-domain-containing protein [Rhizopus microsporus]|uniref:SPRY-domain-containing protein n=1 Tax=Rhizopus microsporus TaxID=58291 RepID=A0A1X0SDU8_RHIZD|nr:SPRY-domain-containing protein [Rhizopus microsporus]